MPWPGIVKMKVFGVFQEPRFSLGMERRMGRPWGVTRGPEASSAALTYAYEFGIEALTAGTVTDEGIPLTSVTIGLKEGSGAAASARNGRLNGTLNVYANGQKIEAYTLKSPVFTNGQCKIEPAQAPVLALAAGEQAVKLTVKLEP